MPSGNLSSAKPNLAFAKIVATPTPTSWSQVYNAGSLFIVISLTLKEAATEHPLSTLGKTIFNHLQSEFFTLEEKTLTTVKQVVLESTTEIPENVTATLSLAYCKQSVLYLVIFGAGKIVMKRETTVGTLLSLEHGADMPIHAASGQLKPEDLVVLMTPQFLEAITEDDLTQALDVTIPNDVAETLTPKVHGAENGGASAIIFSFLGIAPSVFGEEPEEPQLQPADKEEIIAAHVAVDPESQDTEELIRQPEQGFSEKFHMPHFSKMLPPLTHKRKLVLTVAMIIVIVLIASIFFTKQKQQAARQKALYQTTYTTAEAKYKEGTGLISLDKGRAHDDFAEAEKIIKGNINAFPEGSTDRQTLETLLGNVESNLTSTQQLHTLTPTQAADDSAPLLAFENKQNALSYSEDTDNFYYLTQDAVHSVTKSGSTDKAILKNDNDWTNPQALIVYQGNIYLLDSKQGVLKFVAGSDGYGKSSYFPGTVDTSSAVSMAIDGDVWLLDKDGTIKQFTKGKEDTFTVTGLNSPFKNPTKIYTTRDLTYLYVLDTGNQRIVKLGKDGTYKAEYQAAMLGQAKDLTASETDKTISFLANGKVFQITMSD